MVGLNQNERLEIMIRPENLEITEPVKGKLKVVVDYKLFRGYIMKFAAMMRKVMNGWCIRRKKLRLGTKLVCFLLMMPFT